MYQIHHADCFEWLRERRPHSIHAVCTDPPYGLIEAIPSGRTPDREEAISDHPCLKPQHFMRIIVRSLLPLGKGVILDPFMGSGSTIAAAEAVGYESIGVEMDDAYFRQAEQTVPRLTRLYPNFVGDSLMLLGGSSPLEPDDSQQLSLILAEDSPQYGHVSRIKPRQKPARSRQS